MDYKFYQSLVMHQAEKDESPEEVFDEFLEKLQREQLEQGSGAVRRLNELLFSKERQDTDVLGLLKMLDPRRVFLIERLVRLQVISERDPDEEVENAIHEALRENEVSEEKWAEVREVSSQIYRDSEKSKNFNRKASELLKAMEKEYAELMQKYIGKFKEAFGGAEEETAEAGDSDSAATADAT